MQRRDAFGATSRREAGPKANRGACGGRQQKARSGSFHCGPFKQGGLVCSVLPKIPEPLWRQLRVADRMRNVLVAEVLLDRPCILPIIRQVKATSMAQLMRMDREFNPPTFPAWATT